jgi:hypothetical protein
MQSSHNSEWKLYRGEKTNWIVNAHTLHTRIYFSLCEQSPHNSAWKLYRGEKTRYRAQSTHPDHAPYIVSMRVNRMSIPRSILAELISGFLWSREIGDETTDG